MESIDVKFQPRWKEELVCSGALGSFVLEMPMGVVSVYFPTESAWAHKAPAWALAYWDSIHQQLALWCSKRKITLYLDETASVY